MVTREQIVQQALTWEGTPYHHQARCKGAGVDCVQLLLGVVYEVGLFKEGEHPVGYYSPQWHLHKNEELLLEIMLSFGLIEKPLPERLPGDLVVFKFGRVCSHAAIVLPGDQIIHALWERPGRVMVNRLSGTWRTRMRKCLAIPGVT